MKIKWLAISFLFMICIFSGCRNDEYTHTLEDSDFIVTSKGIVTNLLKTDDTMVPQNADSISYGINVNIPDFEFLTYENSRLTLPITIENYGKEFNIGFYIFSDGIIQEYTSDVSDKKTTMQTFMLQRDSVQTIDFYIEDIKHISEKDEISFSFMTMIEPDFIPTIDNYASDLPHVTSGGDSLHLHMKEQPKIGKDKIFSNFETHIISEEEALRFAILLDDRYTGYNTKFVLESINETGRPRENLIAASDNKKLKLNLYGWTINGSNSFSANGTYRVSFYKNHEKIKFNGDFDYIDVELKEGYITSADINLENISEGDFIYCIAVPINNFNLNAKKSMTALVINQNNMPEQIDEEQLFYPVFIDQNSTNTSGNDWHTVEDNEVEEFLKDNSK